MDSVDRVDINKSLGFPVILRVPLWWKLLNLLALPPESVGSLFLTQS